ncbi:MAG TPA: molybdopterin-dependent oxidoreductase, partial [Terricaulis sp.]|nr:molybdopterin-dependent oxidoreductase [Terricaulis sp.]
EIYALKDLIGKLSSPNIDCRQDGAMIDPMLGRASYLFNATIAGIEQADALMIVGSNPRKEAPILNARIRKRWRAGNFRIGVIGEKADLTYDYEYLGAGPDTLAAYKVGRNKPQKPLWLIGQGALARKDGQGVLAAFAKAALASGVISESWNGFSVLHTAA